MTQIVPSKYMEKKTAEFENKLCSESNWKSFEHELEGFNARNFSKGESPNRRMLFCFLQNLVRPEAHRICALRFAKLNLGTLFPKKKLFQM